MFGLAARSDSARGGRGDAGSAWRCACVVAWLLVSSVGGALAQPGAVPEDDSKIHAIEGERRLASGDYPRAAQSFEQAIERNPRRIDLYRRAAVTYVHLRRLDLAVARLRTAAALAPTDGNVAAEFGAYLLEAGEVSDALVLLESTLAGGGDKLDGPAFDAAHLALARYWQRQGAVRGAVVALRRHALRRPSLAPKLQLARLYLRAQLPAQALALVESLPVAEPQVRLVLAEVLAAQDCARATPLLGALDPRSFPSALLLRGRCALQHGNAEGAQEMARSYLALATQGREAAALGHGLLGDAYAAQGNLAEARRRYLSAGVSDPAARLWQIRLAGLHAREGDPATAIAELRRIGPPSPSSLDVEWWLALGAALLQHKERDSLRRFLDELTPQVARAAADPADAELFAPAPPRMVDARAWALQGQLALALGEPETAVAHLEESLRLRATSGVRRLLVDALTEWSAQLLAEDRFDRTIEVLERWEPHRRRAATERDRRAEAALQRNLGIALLLRARPREAAVALGRALLLEPHPSATTAMLHGRALAAAGEEEAARNQLAYAARVASDSEAKEVAIERASLEISTAPEQALRLLRAVEQAPADGDLARRYAEARTGAQHLAAVARLRDGDAEGARVLLEELARTSTDVTLRCNHALATVAARGRGAAAVIRDLGVATCPFAGGSDGLAILSAAVDGQIPGSADRALAELTAVARRSPQSKALVAAATRMVALAAADHAYRRGQLAVAQRYLDEAQRARTAVGDDELAHNLQVQALVAAGGSDQLRLQRVVAELARLEARVPEALINLGVAYDRMGLSQRALEAWRRVRGVRFAPLAEWIRAKAVLEGGP